MSLDVDTELIMSAGCEKGTFAGRSSLLIWRIAAAFDPPEEKLGQYHKWNSSKHKNRSDIKQADAKSKELQCGYIRREPDDKYDPRPSLNSSPCFHFPYVRGIASFVTGEFVW